MLHCALAPFVVDPEAATKHTAAVVVVDGHALCPTCEPDWHRYRADVARYQTLELRAFINWLAYHDNPGKPGGRVHPEIDKAKASKW